MKFSYSYDKGLAWNNTHAMDSFPNPDCDADIIRYTSTIDGYEKNRLIITSPYQGWGRANVSIVISYDEGKTWPTKRQLSQESSGYSAVTIDHDGDIHVHYEKTMSGKGYHMVVDSFSLEWGSYGKDKFEHPVHLNWCVCEEQCRNKCKTGAYVANLKVFDSYVSSYYHYPKHMEYTFVSKVPDYKLNVSIPGLVKYEVTNLNPNKLTISMTGESDHLIDFALKNVKVKAFSNIIYGSTIDLEGSSIDINGTVTRVNIYDGYMMLIISPPKSGRSTSLLNIYLENNQDFEIHKNSDSLDSSIKIVISENSKVSIKGYWSEEEGKRVTISNPNSVPNAVVNIDQPDNVFAYEGSKPSVSNVTKFTSIAIYIIVGGALFMILVIVITILVLRKLKNHEKSEDRSAFEVDFSANF